MWAIMSNAGRSGHFDVMEWLYSSQNITFDDDLEHDQSKTYIHPSWLFINAQPKEAKSIFKFLESKGANVEDLGIFAAALNDDTTFEYIDAKTS